MEITAATMNAMTSSLDATEAVSAVPEAADIEAFSRALFGKENKTPEEMAATGLQEKSASFVQASKNSSSTAEVINNPEVMMKVQSTMSREILEVDLIAKVTGSLSQGINKLTSMQ